MYSTDVMRSYSDDVQQRAQRRASRARDARQQRAVARIAQAPSGSPALPGGDATDPEPASSTGERRPVWAAIVRGLGRAAGQA
jgi:hypothetical protein